jgi:DNA-nicking Smr family endonuclease
VTNRRSDRSGDEFREAMSDVKPLAPRDPVVAAQPKPKPVARFARADEASVLHESLHAPLDATSIETGEELVFRQPGIQLGVVRKLRQGQYAVEAELDLHDRAGGARRHRRIPEGLRRR